MSEGAEYSRLAPAEVSRMRQCCAAAEQRDAAEEHEDAVRLQQLREPLCPGSALEPQEGLRLLERVRLTVDDLRLMFQASGDRQARALFRKSHPELDSEWFNSELAAKIIMEHGVAPAPEGYALQPELKRLPLGDRRVVSMGSSGLLESQWQRQRLELDDDEPPVAVKPLVLPIENACKAGNHGLLHVLIKQDNVPIDVFDTDIARILCEHKWEAFGYKRFVGEVVCFGTQLLAWQTLSYLIAAHGNDALSPLEQPALTVAGALLAFFSLSWPQSLKSALRLSPRPVETAKPGGDGESPSRDLRWHLVDGWRDSSSCPDHGWQDSIPGHIADLLYALHDCAGARCCGCCARLFSALLAMLCEPPLLPPPSGLHSSQGASDARCRQGCCSCCRPTTPSRSSPGSARCPSRASFSARQSTSTPPPP